MNYSWLKDSPKIDLHKASNCPNSGLFAQFILCIPVPISLSVLAEALLNIVWFQGLCYQTSWCRWYWSSARHSVFVCLHNTRLPVFCYLDHLKSDAKHLKPDGCVIVNFQRFTVQGWKGPLFCVLEKEILSPTSVFQPRLLELFGIIGIWTSLSKLWKLLGWVVENQACNLEIQDLNPSPCH